MISMPWWFALLLCGGVLWMVHMLIRLRDADAKLLSAYRSAMADYFNALHSLPSSDHVVGTAPALFLGAEAIRAKADEFHDAMHRGGPK